MKTQRKKENKLIELEEEKKLKDLNEILREVNESIKRIVNTPYGKWKIYTDCEGKNTRYTCPFCEHRRETFAYIPKFCEECGADMRG